MSDPEEKAATAATPASAPATAPAAATAATTAATTAEGQEQYPDPDEDDLDDLDDVLDQFSPQPTKGVPATSQAAGDAAAAASGAGGPATSASETGVDAALPAEADAEVFAAQLQKEMAALMGEIDSSPSMQQQLDAMMAELSTGVPASESKEAQKAAAQAMQAAAKHVDNVTGVDGASGGGSGGGDFQDTIRRTMERMHASGEQASAAANEAGGGETDMLEALLKEMAAGGSGEGEEEFSKMLLGMMEQLTNKEILYEPMKDLHDKFPAWLKENEGKVDKADLERYLEQQQLVGQIVGRFEKEGYADENPEDREFIVERMQKMQAAGSPPADLVGDMKDTQNALGDLEGGCPQQ